jgi:ABC-type antimicrobial peptide transport system permease subunit
MFKENLAARGSVLFAMLALLIALAGVYAIVAYGVARRRREIGIRLALGAAHDGVVYGVVRRAMRLAFIGLVLGTLAALALSRLIGGFLFGVSPGDPLSFSTAFALLAAVSLAASWIPVRRATRVDAVEVLRSD